MKHTGLIGFLVLLLVQGCATSLHKVDQDALGKAKGQVFHIGRVEIPCDALAKFPWPPLRNDKEYQIALLENISVEELRKILVDKYGLSISPDDQLVVNSSATNIIGLLSESNGRCVHKENVTAKDSKNVVNVYYTLSGTFAPPMPASISMGYEIIVKFADNILIEHRDEMESLKLSFFNKSAWDGAPQQIIDNAKRIPDALRKNISEANLN